ncbi:MAG TPA: ImmA/IrrE family metallo-endopeptidase [Polyangiaceae bacterium]|jgi:Zn-dependent peptidase ImmA (M78 family)|nr:ImmA/IrrE family metallo-endopeptidase [Polyangiaceae bacterium]
MRKRYAREIDERATGLLRKFDLFTVPVNVQGVAERLGARVVFDELDDDVSGLLLREKGVSTIVVNRQHHPNRQRFTLAHECGHLFLHADRGDRLWLDKTLFFRDASSSSGDQLAEIQANQFAAGLLMPEELIRLEVAKKRPISEADVIRLAVRFEVSERAMTVRLISLGLLESVAA